MSDDEKTLEFENRSEESTKIMSPVISDRSDILILLTLYLKNRAKKDGDEVTIHYETCDNHNNIKPGSTKEYLQYVGEKNGYFVKHQGNSLMMLGKLITDSHEYLSGGKI